MIAWILIIASGIAIIVAFGCMYELSGEGRLYDEWYPIALIVLSLILAIIGAGLT